VHGLILRFILSLGNVFFSLILGAVALGFFWYYDEETTLQLFRWASSFRERFLLGHFPARYEVIIRALVEERQIVYMGFVLLTRFIVGLLFMLVARFVVGSKPQHELPI